MSLSSIRGLVVLLALVAAACSGDSPPGPEPRAARTSPGEDVAYRFVDVTAEHGIDMDPRRSWGGTWVDYDGDGDPDLMANRHFFPPFAFDHTEDSYSAAAWQDVLQAPDFDRHTCLWGDPNADELPDLFCTQGAERGKGVGPNQLLMQQADGTFVDEARRRGVAYSRGRGRTTNWVDYDSDGDLDLFVGTQLRDGYPNRMFRNDDGTFVRARVGLEEELETEVSAWADWDHDGDPDLLLTLKDAPSVAYENRDGSFRRISIPGITNRDWLGATFGEADFNRWPDLHLISERRSVIFLNNRFANFVPIHRMDARQGRTGVWLDVDNDTDQDLFVLQGAPGNGDDPDAIDAPDVLLVNEEGDFEAHRIRSTGVRSGNGDSVAVSDHDRNGSLDLFVTNGYKRSAGPFLLMENETPGGNWAALDLSGGPGNPLAFWTRVEVRTAEDRYLRLITDGLAFRSQSEVGYLHLGLGAAESAEVVVGWPDGTADCLSVRHGQIAELTKGGAPC